MLDDDALSEETREELLHIEQKIKKSRYDYKLIREYKKEYEKELNDFEQKKNEIIEIKNKISKDKPKSLIEDYADTSTEMPSYMDPED